MASKRQQALDDYEAALNGPGKPAGVKVHQHPEVPLVEDDVPAILLYDAPVIGGVSDQAELVRLGNTGRNQRHTLNIRLEYRVKLDYVTEPGQLLDPLDVWAEAALVNAGQLGGLLLRSAVRQSGSGLVILEGYAARAASYNCQFETRTGNLEA